MLYKTKMKNVIKKLKLIVLLLFLMEVILLNGCGTKQLKTTFVNVDEFGSYALNLSQEEYYKKGYELGDAFKIEYEAEDGSKQVLEDIPCFSSYAAEKGRIILVAYRTDQIIKIARNDLSIEEIAKHPKEGGEITLTLTNKGKYKELNDIIGINVSKNRDDYKDDITFVNYREIVVGKIKPGKLSRSTNPLNNSINRANDAAKMTLANNVNTYIDISQEKEEIMKNYDKLPENSKKIIDEHNNIYMHMLPKYGSEDMQKKLVELFDKMSKLEPKYHIFCLEGKDRTGYVCAILEALCGASYEEIVDDYMKSYEYLCMVDKQKNKNKYDYYANIKFTEMLTVFTGCETIEEIKKINLYEATKKYLISIGVSQENIDTIIKKLTE